MTNQTTPGYWQGRVSYRSSLLSAEWIEEAPSSFAGILPLADFQTASFSATNGADGATPKLSFPSNAIQMDDPDGQTANPSNATSMSANFDVCWGYQSFTRCN